MNSDLILVVEDDSAIRNLITSTLKTHDYKFITASNGKNAIMQASSYNPSIILLDLGLPDIDGVEIIKTIRTWSEVPIIVISARSEDRDKIDALDAGADDYLTKPFSIEELLARIRVTQRRLISLHTVTMTDSVFLNGKLKVDYAAGCAYINDNEKKNIENKEPLAGHFHLGEKLPSKNVRHKIEALFIIFFLLTHYCLFYKSLFLLFPTVNYPLFAATLNLALRLRVLRLISSSSGIMGLRVMISNGLSIFP